MNYRQLQQQTRSLWKTWPGREPALLLVRRTLGEYDSESLRSGSITDAVKFTAVQAGEADPSNAVYVASDVVVLIPSEALPPGVTPQPGYQIVRRLGCEDEATFTLLRVRSQKFGTTYRCEARNLTLAFGLTDLGSLLRPTNAKDAAGRLSLASYATVADAIPCRLQPADTQADEKLGRVTAPKRFTCFLGRELDARAKDVFVVGGTRYTVSASHSPERIDQLQTLSLELIS